MPFLFRGTLKYRDLTYAFNGKVSAIGAIPVVGLLLAPFIGLCSKKMCQFGIHHFAEVFSHHLSNVEPDHLEQLLRLRLNLFENGR